MKHIKLSNVLIKASRLCGSIPLIVGWGIFLVWAFINLLTGANEHRLEILGLYWILVSVVLGLAGIILNVVHGILNRRFARQNVNILLLTLSGIPSVIIIITLTDLIH